MGSDVGRQTLAGACPTTDRPSHDARNSGRVGSSSIGPPPGGLPAGRPPRDPAIRRRVEAAMALAALVLLSPLLVAITVGVRVTGRGPVIFRQERLGVGRQPFTILKFRTMVVGNDERIHRDYVTALLTSSEAPHGGQQGVYKLTNDPRVTRVGAFLRRTSLDELPQLWNVVRGEMALVGPRPVLPWEEPMFPAWAGCRFDVRPGITGLWQVRGRSRLGFHEALMLDVQYARTRSLWLDVKILAATPSILLDGRAR